MNEPFRRADSIAAKVYAVLAALFGLAFLFLAYVFFNVFHTREAVMYPSVPGVILLVMSGFIWRGAMWTMLLVAVGVLGLVLVILYDDPSIVGLLAVPAVFAALTGVCIVCRTRGRAAA